MKNMKEFYQAKYKGSLFVVKAGGRVITDDAARASLLEDIKNLTDNGIKVLLVYGGGHAIDDALNAAGIAPRKHEGRRITGVKEIKIVKQVLSADLGYKISSTMAALELNGLCLNGVPASWINITPRPRDNEDNFGYDGTISAVHGEHIRPLFDRANFIATPCLGITQKNGVNINADNVAVALAEGCVARKLIFLSDVDGVLVDGKVAPFITDKEIPALIENGTVTGGMQVKLENCLHAMQNGVRRIHLLDGFRHNALTHEIYESEGPATMIIREQDREAYLSEIALEKAIEAQYKQHS